MRGYLLDTNVVSELVKRQPNPGVLEWIAREAESFLSVLTIGELERGARLLQQRDVLRAERLAHWIEGLRISHAEKILPIDVEVAASWARLPAQRTLPVIDGLLAATAVVHDLTVVTRNTKDFADTGARTVNPFRE